MRKTLIVLMLLASPASASQNGFFESQRLEGARQDKANKPPSQSPVDLPVTVEFERDGSAHFAPPAGCPDHHVTATWSSAIPCKPRD